MKEPESKLPFRATECFTNDKECWCRVLKDSADDDVISYGSAGKQDVEYIEQACNNFPKAVELLKKIRDEKVVYISDFQDDSFIAELLEFFKEIDV